MRGSDSKPAPHYVEHMGEVSNHKRSDRYADTDHSKSSNATRLHRGEVCNATLAVPRSSVGGNEQEVVQVPRGVLGSAGAGALLRYQRAENAAQRDDRETLGLELYEKYAPRLTCNQRAKLLDLLNLGRGFRIEAKFFGL